jgi:hypothetical protein
MENRIKRLQGVGFMSGANDIWRVFVFAPRGYFLQDWVEFKRKYNYMQFRVMEWLLAGNKDKYPTPHPFVRYAKVFEQSYDHIKARFLFALKTGLSAPSITAKIGHDVKPIDLKVLLLDELHDYLKFVAPFCSEEEYLVFEQMAQDMNDEEDDIIQELCDLETKTSPGFTSSRGSRAKSSNYTELPFTIDGMSKKKRVNPLKEEQKRVQEAGVKL